MKVVIMAGGKGSRIASLFPELPKPMILINGVPILEMEIVSLRDQGFTDIIITVSYMAEKIMSYFGDGSKFRVNIEYFVEKEPLGNAGALFRIKDKLKDDFLLLNADALFDIDFNRFVEFHKKTGGLVTLFTHPNSHPYDSGLIISNEESQVVEWISKEDCRPKWYKNRVNAGLHIISPILLEQNILTNKIDLDEQILKPLAGSGKMYVYDSPEYVKDMGTPERYKQVCSDYKNDIPQKKSFKNKQKAIFLDRDGTINKYKGFITNINDFELIDGVVEAIKRINESEYLAIVVTNQPVIARGEVSFEQLEEIHKKMETLLGEKGVYIDALYFCPHHPHKGYLGEVAELKIDCNCRKPKPGMLLQASKDFNIDLSKSFMIGDSMIDYECGINAGVLNSFVVSDKNSLLSIIDQIIGGKKSE